MIHPGAVGSMLNPEAVGSLGDRVNEELKKKFSERLEHLRKALVKKKVDAVFDTGADRLIEWFPIADNAEFNEVIANTPPTDSKWLEKFPELPAHLVQVIRDIYKCENPAHIAGLFKLLVSCMLTACVYKIDGRSLVSAKMAEEAKDIVVPEHVGDKVVGLASTAASSSRIDAEFVGNAMGMLQDGAMKSTTQAVGNMLMQADPAAMDKLIQNINTILQLVGNDGRHLDALSTVTAGAQAEHAHKLIRLMCDFGGITEKDAVTKLRQSIAVLNSATVMESMPKALGLLSLVGQDASGGAGSDDALASGGSSSKSDRKAYDDLDTL